MLALLGSFWAVYVAKLAIVGAGLTILYATGRWLRGWRVFARVAERRIAIVESAMLSQHAAIHLLRLGTRYLLVGTGSGGVCVLAELSAAEAACELKPRST